MPVTKSKLGIALLFAASIAAAAVVGTGGCSHGTSTMPGPRTTPSPSPSPSGSPSASPSPAATANYYISMAYASMSPTIDPTYGPIDGYALVSPPPTPPSSPTPTPSPKPSPTAAPTPGLSSVVVVPCNANVQFLNFDVGINSFRTASLLIQPPGGGFPAHYNNGNGTNASVALTPLTFMNFSTGFVLPDVMGIPGRSLVYTTGNVPATLYIGDYTSYDASPSMRTVILVECP